MLLAGSLAFQPFKLGNPRVGSFPLSRGERFFLSTLYVTWIGIGKTICPPLSVCVSPCSHPDLISAGPGRQVQQENILFLNEEIIPALVNVNKPPMLTSGLWAGPGVKHLLAASCIVLKQPRELLFLSYFTDEEVGEPHWLIPPRRVDC